MLFAAQAAPDSPHAGVPHAGVPQAGASQAGSQHFGSQGSHFGFRQFSLGSFSFGSFSFGISSFGSLHFGVSQQVSHLFPAWPTSAAVRTNATAITHSISFLNISYSRSTDSRASLQHPRPLRLNLHHLKFQGEEISGRSKIGTTVIPACTQQDGCPDLVNVSCHVKRLDIHHSADQKISCCQRVIKPQ